MKGVTSMRTYTLSKRDAQAVFEKIEKTWPNADQLPRPRETQIVEIDEGRSLLLFEAFVAAQLNQLVLPFLQSEKALALLPLAVVDAGAVPHICNGADVMRPGITRFEGTFTKNELVAVQEQRHGKYIAVGLALANRPDAEAMRKGPVLQTIHYVGDRFWEAYKAFKGGRP